MKFFFQYVNNLKEPKRIKNEIDPARLGILLHAAIKNLYTVFIGKEVDSKTINSLINNKQFLTELISEAIILEFSGENRISIAINEMIVREVLYNYILRILEFDKAAAPFKIIDLEKPVTCRMTFRADDGKHEIMVGGKIDRVDWKDGITRIVDYKTGKITGSINSLDSLFEDDRDKESDCWLQTLLYCEAYQAELPGTSVRPLVYGLKKSSGELNSEKLRIQDEFILDDYNVVKGEFLEGLEAAITKIFSCEEPYIMTTDSGSKCTFCPYRILCMR